MSLFIFPLYCLFFSGVRLLITTLGSSKFSGYSLLIDSSIDKLLVPESIILLVVIDSPVDKLLVPESIIRLVVIDSSVDKLLVPESIIRLVVIDSSVDKLLVPESLIRLVVSASALTWFIRYIYVQLLNNKIDYDTPTH